MRRISVKSLPLFFVIFVLASAAVSFSQQVTEDRILQAIDQRQMTTLRGFIHPLARAEFDQGRVSSNLPMQNVSILFKLSATQQAALDQLLAEQQDPTSPNYRKWLTPEQYAARFGLSQNDLDKITTWLQSQGFTGIQVAPSHTRISFSATAARIEAAFRTEIHTYQEEGEVHFANATEPSVPAAFADAVQAFRHFDDFRPKSHLRRPDPRFTSSVSGNHFLSPGDFATIYDLTPLYNVGLDGTGVTIAVMGQTQLGATATDVSDTAAFRSAAGLPGNSPQLLVTPGTGTSAISASDVDEANLDVEWSGGVAKGATVLYDYAGTTGDVIDAFTDALENNRAPVVSISYGLCESGFGTATVQSLHSLVQQGLTHGQTVSAAAGDDGAADCENGSTVATSGLAVDAPGSIPEVSSIGGTEFMGDNTTGADPPFWAPATNSTTDDISSALIYIPEMAWNDTALESQLAATGGGKSTIFAKPGWQTALTPADGQRDVPDVSFSGSLVHDGYLVCSGLDQSNQQSCTSGFRDSGGSLDLVGGTSVGAQVFGGILAILNQATKSNGLGNANIELYTLAASTPSAFHDVTTGNNIVPCTSGSTGCPATAPFQIGFAAGPGYDLVTGLGSLDVNNLARAWPGFSLAPGFSLSAANVTIAAPGTAGTSMVTITPGAGFTGTIALTCAAPGSETACSFTAPTAGATTSVTISGSGAVTATLSVSTTAPHAKPGAGSTAKALPLGGLGWFGASGGTLLAGFFAVGVPSRRRRGTAMLGLLFCVCLAVGVGCGGGAPAAGGSKQTDPGTPAGSYTIVVTGTSGNFTTTANLAVTVQ